MVFLGETHRTWWDRSTEHRIALRTGDQTNPLVKHMMIHHPQEDPDFTWKVDKSHKTSLSRQIRESLMIARENQSMLMNSKTEWGSGNTIPRVIISGEDPGTQSANNSSPNPPRSQPSDEATPPGPTSKRRREDGDTTTLTTESSRPLRSFFKTNQASEAQALRGSQAQMVPEANREQSLTQSYEDVRPESVKLNEILRKLDNEMGAEGEGQGNRKRK